ncbi:hypothetical protein [Amycolatopsis speibonae]|uniref:MmyB-like transcription regulator ligand binding domain-containing protein n=1 Tax=Amycolatopsis speibonae TaxID=1450224 RepID=A0ABV7PCI8_9PSEU
MADLVRRQTALDCPRVAGRDGTAAGERRLRLLDRMSDLPALVLSAKSDMLAGNSLAADCVGCLRTAQTRYPHDPDLAGLIDGHAVLVYSAVPGTPGASAVDLLRVTGLVNCAG